ncbi:MAG TPA: hypothetical protein VLN42_12010 [Casimicrobiaceae bacterium]|nr:hypothetical protein [Casimicrobiaceae bacterium]
MGAAKRCGVILSIIGMLAPSASGAAPGTIDVSFGGTGSVNVGAMVSRLQEESVSQNALLRTASAELIETGNVWVYLGGFISYCAHGFVARYSSSGVLDASFGDGGVVFTDSCIGPTLVLPDRRIVAFGQVTVAGSTDTTFAIRLLPDGTPDPSFGHAGWVQASLPFSNGPVSAALQPDGKYVVTLGIDNAPGFAAIRFDSGGLLDTQFGTNGIAKIGPQLAGATSLAIQADGKAIISGGGSSGTGTLKMFLARLTSDGRPDPAFGKDGIVEMPFSFTRAPAMLLQQDGKIVLGTTEILDRATNRFALMRFLPDGSLDPSFGIAGTARTQFGLSTHVELRAIDVLPDGRLIAAGDADGIEAVVVRYGSDGTADADFGVQGRVTVPGYHALRALVPNSDGSLVLAAESNAQGLLLVKLQGDGVLDVIEFYNASLDHYFLAADASEAHDLDFGIHAGWSRTGSSFKAWPMPGASARPVCRYYLPPEHGDSHFFSADIDECSAIAAKTLTDPSFSGYVLETPDAFAAILPDRATGNCAPGTIPVFRLWNGRSDSNHRFTTSAAMRQDMIDRAYIPEGYGALGVVMCASGSQSASAVSTGR